MDRLRLGINTSFALRRWSQPRQWMELIYSQLELDLCELSLDLIDPNLREPTKTMYIQEILELQDDYPIEIVSCRTGQNKYREELLLHPNLGYRIDAIQWFEKAIDIAAYTNAAYFGGHFGGFVNQNQVNSKQFDYHFSFLQDSLRYLSSVAYAAGLFGFFYEPFSFIPDNERNLDLNQILRNKIQEQAKIQILISPDANLLNIQEWISNFSSSIQLISIQNAIQAKNLHDFLDQLGIKFNYKINLILNITSMPEKSESQLLHEILEPINEIKGILS